MDGAIPQRDTILFRSVLSQCFKIAIVCLIFATVPVYWVFYRSKPRPAPLPTEAPLPHPLLPLTSYLNKRISDSYNYYWIVSIQERNFTSQTQSLFFCQGKLFESCGVYGNSSITAYTQEGESFHTENYIKADNDVFFMGATSMGGKEELIYQLSWQNRLMFA